MRNFLLLFILILAAIGFVAEGAKLPDDNVLVGTKTIQTKGFEFNFAGANTKLQVLNDGDNTLNYDHNAFAIGDGSSASAKKLIFNGYGGAALEVDNYILDWNQNQFNVGDGTATDKRLYWNYGSLDKYIGYNSTTGKAVFNNGTGEEVMGSGTGGGGTGGINFLANTGFEDVDSPIANWTATGGTFTQQTYTNGRTGNLRYARFVSTGAGEYFISDAITVSDDVNGGCMADFKYNQGDTAFDYKVLKSPYADPADVISEGSVGDLTEFLKAPTITYPCNGGDVLKFKVISTGAGTIEADEAYLGSNKGFIDYDALNKFSARIANSGSSSITSQSADAVLSVNWTATGVTDIVFKPGFFTVIPGVGATQNEPAANAALEPEVYNLTTSGCTVRTLSNAAAASDRDFTLWMDKQGVDAAKTLPAFAPEQADFLITAVITSGSNMTSSAADIPFGAPNAEMTMVHGSAQIPCAPGTESSGLTCSGVDENFGIAFQAPRAALYEVCGNIGPTSEMTGRFVLVDNTSGAIIQDTLHGVSKINAVNEATVTTCRIFSLPLGKNTIKLLRSAAGSLGAIVAVTAGAEEARSSRIAVKMIGHYVSRPIIQNMVDTKNSNGSRIEVCRIENNGTASFDTADPECSWISSVLWTALGQVNVVPVLGTFSAPPRCFAYITSAVYRMAGTDAEETTNLITVDTFNSSSARENLHFNIFCKGAR